MDLGIKGKRALVLGASKGLGYSTARALAQEGVDIALSSSSQQRADDAAKKLATETSAKVVGLVGDVSNPYNMNVLADGLSDSVLPPIDLASLTRERVVVLDV